ncbi:MAG: response regulator [Methylacidiphilales bacterium]|nr:response regulator [Candidatus Methylacidiphilales bacterium]
MSEAAPTVYVIDDDASFLVAIARFLRASKFQVKAFFSAAEFLGQITPDISGCVLVDLHMPGMDGLELQAELARARHTTPVIFLTGQGDIPSSVHAMRDGAEDYLEKLAPKNKLVEAVRRALARDARERAERARRSELRVLFDSLTEREREVLGHVVQGKLNKHIACDLGINERTVKAHRTAITTKLGVPSVAELTRMALDAGVFPEAALTSPKGL